MMTGLVAITGATGFAGPYAVELLGRRETPMRLLVRKGPYSCGFGTAETVIGSLENEVSLRQLVSGASAVIHFAGAIAARSRAEFFATNAEGTRRLADAATAAGVKRFIYISSLAAREPTLSDYGASKRAAEEVLLERSTQFDLTILRPPAVYGPADRASLPLLGQLTRRFAFIPGSSTARFSLLYVEDLAQAIVSVLDNKMPGLHEIDDGTPNGYAWPELVAIAARAEKHPVTPIYIPRALLLALAVPITAVSRLAGAVPFLSGDKVRQLYYPDWICRAGKLELPRCVRFEEGFARAVEWYREREWLPPARPVDKSEARSGKGEPAS